jgi:orotate phosphoribosyltransferase
VIGLARQERGAGEMSAIQEIEQTHGVPVISIIKMEHIIDYLGAQGGDSLEARTSMEVYRDRYGVQSC